MPLNWRSSRTTCVNREVWGLAESERAAKSAMARRGLLTSPRPVPARNHPWDCAAVHCAANAKSTASESKRNRLNTQLTLTSDEQLESRFSIDLFPLLVLSIREIPKDVNVGSLPVAGERWKGD